MKKTLNKICVILLTAAIPIGLFPHLLDARNFSETENVIRTILQDTSDDRSLAKDQKSTEKTGTKESDASAKAASLNINSEDMILLKTGIQFYNSGLFTHAKAKFNEILTAHPNSPFIDQSRVWIGKILMHEHGYGEAVKILSTVSKNSGEYPASLYLIAGAQLRQGRRADSLAGYNLVASRYPEHDLADDALYSMGKILYEDRKGPQALPIVIKIIKEYKDRETVDDAFYLMGKIFELDPTYRDAETARAVYRSFLKRAESGVKYFHKSPLLKKVSYDLKNIERTHFRMEN